jgi:hypothetical protein
LISIDNYNAVSYKVYYVNFRKIKLKITYPFVSVRA